MVRGNIKKRLHLVLGQNRGKKLRESKEVYAPFEYCTNPDNSQIQGHSAAKNLLQPLPGAYLGAIEAIISPRQIPYIIQCSGGWYSSYWKERIWPYAWIWGLLLFRSIYYTSVYIIFIGDVSRRNYGLPLCYSSRWMLRDYTDWMHAIKLALISSLFVFLGVWSGAFD